MCVFINVLSIVGSLCSILSFLGIIIILNKKIRVEIYRNEDTRKIEIYEHILDASRPQSAFAKTEELKKNKEFKRKHIFLYYFEDKEIDENHPLSEKRKGQYQTQYISFWGCFARHATKKYVKNNPSYNVEYLRN